MKHLAIFFFFISAFHKANGQAVRLDTVLGKRILQEQKARLKNLDGKQDYLTFWNTAVAYRYLGAPADSIYACLVQSMRSEPGKFLETVDVAIQLSKDSIENLAFYKILGPKFTELTQEARLLKNLQPTVHPKDSMIVNQWLVNRLEKLLDNDQKYRGRPTFSMNRMEQQMQWELDSLNAIELELLYKEYGYPGRSVTGDNKYQNYFCIIVHHLQTPSGKYRHWFPIIEKAYFEKELSSSVFKLLLDRLHAFDTGKQYFGTQSGIPLENEDQIKSIEKKYGLE